MMVASGPHTSHVLRELNGSKPSSILGFGLGFCSGTNELCAPCFLLMPPKRMSISSLKSISSSEFSAFSEALSIKNVGNNASETITSVAGGFVALGKFDALHIGHRELAIQASKKGIPYLLSFIGIEAVLGWEPRIPVVAKSDRGRILSSWAQYCGSVAPSEFHVEFSTVRHLTPEQFVKKLTMEFGVRGVVAGENYRFGYKAAGDAAELVRLCKEYGLEVSIINSVMDWNQEHLAIKSNDSKEKGQVSSTRVRHALAEGDMKYVSELLGRPHRLLLTLKDLKEPHFVTFQPHLMISAPKSCLLNQPPKDGIYENCSRVIGKGAAVKCKVCINPSEIHINSKEVSSLNCNFLSDSQIVGIEFL